MQIISSSHWEKRKTLSGQHICVYICLRAIMLIYPLQTLRGTLRVGLDHAWFSVSIVLINPQLNGRVFWQINSRMKNNCGFRSKYTRIFRITAWLNQKKYALFAKRIDLSRTFNSCKNINDGRQMPMTRCWPNFNINS